VKTLVFRALDWPSSISGWQVYLKKGGKLPLELFSQYMMTTSKNL